MSAPQNRAKTGQFKKGQSGNPGGRPKGLMGLIREQTSDGAEYVEFMLAVARGHPIPSGDDVVLPTLRDRREAWEALADRGFGKAIQAVDLGSSGEPLSFRIERAK